MPKLSNVEVFFLPPNMTAGLQPLHAGMIANFKVMYRRRVLSKSVSLMDMTVHTSMEQPDLKINLLMAMQFIRGAWSSKVGVSMVRNCFRKACFVRGRSDLDEACEVPTDEVMPELWSTVDEDASQLEEFLHADNALVTSELLTDEAIVANPELPGLGFHAERAKQSIYPRLVFLDELGEQVGLSLCLNRPTPLICEHPTPACSGVTEPSERSILWWVDVPTQLSRKWLVVCRSSSPASILCATLCYRFIVVWY
ncbi:hypothetical protein HPB49_013073 [Dermacentor silvarum]|uniref:Uncharacterized protein n=1 Tax=Dermacentor silvarum TaxID=543639 RepID=A0ACB8DZY5_DERSI|nr:hypothetical protein HPB49_013073 [Dermacentor silvarum]